MLTEGLRHFHSIFRVSLQSAAVRLVVFCFNRSNSASLPRGKRGAPCCALTGLTSVPSTGDGKQGLARLCSHLRLPQYLSENGHYAVMLTSKNHRALR